MYPNPTPISDTKPPSLTYCHAISGSGQPVSGLVDLACKMTFLYRATLDGDQRVVVKFTSQYNQEAHKLLASRSLAPKLYYCERVVGGLYMVVMEHVEAKSLSELRWSPKVQIPGLPIPSIVLTKVEEALRILHSAEIVFGDLREPNILYAHSDSRVFLVDFDWCGKHDEHRYPATVNQANGYREDVRGYALMRKEHDTFMLNKLHTLHIVI